MGKTSSTAPKGKITGSPSSSSAVPAYAPTASPRNSFLAPPAVDLIHSGSEPRVIIIDLETTGFSPTKDRVIQLAAMVMPSIHGHDGGRAARTGTTNTNMAVQDYFNAFVRPRGASISPAVQDLTGISQAFVEAEGVSFGDAWADFITWLQDVPGDGPVVLLAHNGKSFDFNFLQAELDRSGKEGLCTYVDCLVDTLHVVRDPSLWEGGPLTKPDAFGLAVLYKHVTTTLPANSHNALFDVMALAEILETDGLRSRWRAVANRKQFLL